MNHKFDELAKGLAQSVTRRQALKKFGVGLAGMALACFGLAKRAKAQTKHSSKCVVAVNMSGGKKSYLYSGACVDPNTCLSGLSPDCPAFTAESNNQVSLACSNLVLLSNRNCSF